MFLDQDRKGYILRISKDDWERQVFEQKKYYTGLSRGWKLGTIIFFVRKREAGDSFIGYGIVEKIDTLSELTPEEEKYCEENGWKLALKFKYVSKFSTPYPIKNSILSNDVRKGRYLHGVALNEDQVNEILEKAKDS